MSRPYFFTVELKHLSRIKDSWLNHLALNSCSQEFRFQTPSAVLSLRVCLPPENYLSLLGYYSDFEMLLSDPWRPLYKLLDSLFKNRIDSRLNKCIISNPHGGQCAVRILGGGHLVGPFFIESLRPRKDFKIFFLRQGNCKNRLKGSWLDLKVARSVLGSLSHEQYILHIILSKFPMQWWFLLS